KDVDISRDYVMRHSGKKFKGVPIIAANMDGVGTFEMAKAFIADGNGLSVALHKHYSLDRLQEFFKAYGGQSVWYSIGFAQDDQEKLKAFLASDVQKSGQGIEKLCVDVANGYSQYFVD